METVPWGDVRWVLDVGCGTGLLEQETQSFQLSLRMVGVDICADMLRQARHKSLPRDRFSWVVAAAEEMPFRSAAFDAVICADSSPSSSCATRTPITRPLASVRWTTSSTSCRLILRIEDRNSHWSGQGVNRSPRKTLLSDSRCRSRSRPAVECHDWGRSGYKNPSRCPDGAPLFLSECAPPTCALSWQEWLR